jgi:adenosine deaminase
LIDLARSARAPLPSQNPDELRRFMVVNDAGNLEDYLRRFEITVTVLQTPEAIERVAYEMVEDAARENIRYLEVRFCPALSRREGMTLDEVVAAELRGLARGSQDFGVQTGVINCALRNLDPSLSIEIAECSARFAGRGVVGFDLAGGEAGRPASVHREAFQIAGLAGLGRTVHAGEGAGPESIVEAIFDCGAERLGHATRLEEDPVLQGYVRDRRITLEANITSNVQTRVVPRAADHPVRRYLDAGLAVTLSTDNWLMSGVTLTSEYQLAARELGFTRSEIDRLILHGFAGAFLAWPEKQRLITEVRAELQATR